MKKFLLTLAAAALCASAAFADATVVIKDQTPYTGGATTDAVEWTNGNFTFNPAKGDPKATAPSFNRAGDLRLYAKNTFTITTTGPEMTKIVFNISAQGLKRLTVVSADNGTIATQAKGDATVTWTGSSKNVVFTVAPEGEKAIYGTEDTKAGQLDFDKIEITGGGEVVPPTPNTATFELVNAVSDGEFVFVVDGKVGEAIPASSSYGRLSLVEATFDGNKVTTAVGNIIKIAAANGGYTLQDANGRYLGFDGEHKTSFQLYTEVNEYTVWAIAMTNGEAAITMTVGESTGTVGVTKGSEGTWYTNIAPSVGADEIMLPKLYKKGGSSSVETITVDQNAPVEYFNLQGIRVENPANGLYIRRQGNNVAKVYIR